MRSLEIDEGWVAKFEPNSPDWMIELMNGTITAYQSGDLDWALQASHPEIVIVQPRELPDARTYHGHDGLIDALLDWPKEWEDFSVTPTRIFAPDDDHVIVVATHRGRSLKMSIEIEAEIVWLYTLADGLLTRWDMYLDLEHALDACR